MFSDFLALFIMRWTCDALNSRLNILSERRRTSSENCLLHRRTRAKKSVSDALLSRRRRKVLHHCFFAKMNLLSSCCLLPFLVILMSNSLLFHLSLVSCQINNNVVLPFSSQTINSGSAQAQVILSSGSQTDMNNNQGSNSGGNRQQPGWVAVRCNREPLGVASKKTPGDNGFKIKISGNPEKYTPGEVYTGMSIIYVSFVSSQAHLLQHPSIC